MNQARAATDGAKISWRWAQPRIDAVARSALRALLADATLTVKFDDKGR
jgi:hypothetical protein